MATSKSSKGFRLVVWGSLSEPKLVTVVMVVTYLFVGVSGLTFICDRTPDTPAVAAGAVLMMLGGVLGTPSAWRGAWWLEGPAAVLSVAGMMVIAAMEVTASLSRLEWPQHTVVVTLIAACFFITRALRVWPEMYRPGTIPVREIELAKARMQGAQQAERNASAAH